MDLTFSAYGITYLAESGSLPFQKSCKAGKHYYNLLQMGKLRHRPSYLPKLTQEVSGRTGKLHLGLLSPCSVT